MSKKYKIDEWAIDRFEKSTNRNKKYDAWIVNVETGEMKKIPFGAINYQHYMDTTPLKLYSNLDHNDEERRRKFYQRMGDYDPNYITAKMLSSIYLW